MSELIKKLEAFRANLVGEDMNYRACLVDEAIGRIRALEKALTPSGDTKADYHGDFEFKVYQRNLDGDDSETKQTVPWTTIKEIMVRILERAARVNRAATRQST